MKDDATHLSYNVGHRLERLCPECGKKNTHGSRYCRACIQNLSSSRHAVDFPVYLLILFVGMLLSISAGSQKVFGDTPEAVPSKQSQNIQGIPHSLTSQPSDTHILIITSQPYVTEWFSTLNDAFRKTVSTSFGKEIKISYEYIGSEKIADKMFDRKIADLLQKKYENIQLDIVVAVMPASSRFLLDYGEKIFPEVSTIYALPSEKQVNEILSKPRTALVESVSDIAGAIESIRTLLPSVEHLIVVSGAGADDIRYVETTRNAINTIGWPRDVAYLTGTPADELSDRLSQLPEQSAILMLTYVKDRNGKALTTVEVMKKVSSHTSAPIFSFYDTVLGHGIVGGRLTSAEAYGRAIATAAVKQLSKEDKQTLVRVRAEIREMYDWRELKHWKINPGVLPEGSIIRFREISFWEANRNMVIFALVIFLLQSALITVLVFSLVGRRKAEAELSKHRYHLEEMVKERTAKLMEANDRLKIEIEDRIRFEQMLTQSEAKYRNLVESANSVIIRWLKDGQITFFNRYAQDFFGYSEQEIIGKNILDTIVPPKDSSGRDLSSLAQDIGLNPEAYARNVNENIRKNGERVWVAWANKAIVDEMGNVMEILSVGNDITKLKEIEEELRNTLDELAVAKECAEAADKIKSAFLATMSHELRTPLNSIIGFTGVILRERVGPLNDEQRKQLNMVRESSRHLLALINDVLDISKIEAGQLELAHDDIDLPQTIEKVEQSTRPLADKKGLELGFEISPEMNSIPGDRRRVEQILLNLLSNAIKFTEKGSIKIVCQADEDNVIVSVIDTGIGIKTEDMETIFKSFSQIDSGISRTYEGTGLGLSISKRLVELMGGKIWVTSTWGSGSTFSFSLPKERRNA